jgi:hypothetical protein
VWTAEANGTLDLDGGVLAVSTGAQFNGAGVNDVTSFGTLNVLGNVTANSFTIAGGTLEGGGTFTVTGTLTWTGGGISNPGGTVLTVDIPVGATLSIQGNSNTSVSGGTLNLAGTTTWSGTGNFNTQGTAVVNNEAGATFTIQNNQSLGSGTFNNAGTLVKTGTGTTNVSVFINFTNSGTIDVQSGELNFAADLVQTAGSTVIASGATLAAGSFAGGSMHLNGGTLSGSGTLSGGLINNATVTPGGVSAAGVLTVTGNYTQGAGAILAINVAGTTPGTQYSQLAVGGTATLAGTLDLNSLNSFAPPLGSSYTPLTYASATGSFALGGTLNPGSGHRFDMARNATSLTVTDDLIPPPPPRRPRRRLAITPSAGTTTSTAIEARPAMTRKGDRHLYLPIKVPVPFSLQGDGIN